jgi:hypothetical protein
LTRDGLTSPGYLDAHNGHWITLLRLDYRLNFQLWGLRSYLPYQVPVVLAHLAAAVLVRVVMCRLGVRGWIATAGALAFLFFGSGRENMVFGFQVSMTGSLVCGLALFLMSEGPRRVTRRDGQAICVGLVGLMTSAAFPPIVVGVAVTTLLRRGRRVAALYGGSLGVIYALWYAAYGRDNATLVGLGTQAILFAARMFWATFDALAQGGVGAVLVALAALGLGTAIQRAWRSGVWDDAALPIGLAVSWMGFAALTALARAELAETYASGRYLHIGAALLLPLVAAGAEQLARRRVVLGAAALLPLVIGVPGNLDQLAHTDWVLRGNPQLIYALAHSPFVDDVAPETRVLRSLEMVPLTAGWLARHAEDGHIPEPDTTDPVRDLTATGSLVLAQRQASPDQPSCPPLTAALNLRLQSGDEIGFTGAINVAATEGNHEGQSIQFRSSNGSVVHAQAGPVDVVVRAPLGQSARVCEPPGASAVTPTGAR